VIVGAGQLTWRDRDDATSPLELMTVAARAAAADTGAGDALLARVESLAAVECLSWPVPDPARALAEALAIEPAETVRSARGGNGPIQLLADICERIAYGELDVALLAGGEAMNPFMRALREGRATGWPEQPEGTAPDRIVGQDRDASTAAELAAGLIAPIAYYPLFENALRGAAGREPGEHTQWLGRLWARLARVAAENPHAWTHSAPDAEAIATPAPDNRMAALPYTKLMTANIQVDQGAALVVCSAQAAQDSGVPRQRWVFVDATASAHDHWFVSERDALDRSPALAACGRAALGHAGLGIDDVALLDLYSCFPSAVQVAARELGIDLEDDAREPTLTGGLTFAGGPANNYCTHSLAALVERLRSGGGAGLVTAVGWYLTKHAAAVLSADPPEVLFAHHDVQDEVDALPRRGACDGAQRAGSAAIEAYTALYERDGRPSVGIVSCLLDDGRRAIAKSDDAAELERLVAGDPLGTEVVLDGAGRFATR